MAISTSLYSHLRQRNGAISGKRPEDATCAQLGANDTGPESNKENKGQAESTTCLLRHLSEELCQGQAGIGASEGIEILDGEHEADKVSNTGAKGNDEGDCDCQRGISGRLNESTG